MPRDIARHRAGRAGGREATQWGWPSNRHVGWGSSGCEWPMADDVARVLPDTQEGTVPHQDRPA
eukprot:4823978-Prymnesium_polylepis.1